MEVPITLQLPLVVRSDDGVALFGSVEGLRGYVEVPDIESGVYGPAFDAAGRLLTIQLPEQLYEDPPSSFGSRLRWRLARNFNPVSVRAAELEPTHQDALKRLLSTALGSSREDVELRGLVEAAKSRYGITAE